MTAPLHRGRPFFALPLEHLVETIAPMATSLRTLSDAQLASELEQLGGLCRGQIGNAATGAMLHIYKEETARREAPDQAFDEELDAVLSRLERATTTEDRSRVVRIGGDLYAIGGDAAMVRARVRMLSLVNDKRRPLRAAIIAKRWRGVGLFK